MRPSILILCNMKGLTMMKKTIAAAAMAATLMSYCVNAATGESGSIHYQHWLFGMIGAYSSGCGKLSESGNAVAFHIAKRGGLDLNDLGDSPGFNSGWDQMNREGCRATKKFFEASDIYDLLFQE